MKEQLKQKRKHILFLGTTLAVLVVIVGILVGCFIYSGSYEYQMIKANAAIEKEDYSKEGDYYHFYLVYDLEAGETYYFGAQQYYGYLTEFLVTLEKV